MDRQSRSYLGPGANPVLLDVTRLVSLRWTGRRANGIDRVSLAYLDHFGQRAQAVVQHRGFVRVLGRDTSCRLFEDLARERVHGARLRLVAHLAGALAGSERAVSGSLYLNTSHTDFDLPAHARWTRRHGLRPIYLLHDLIPLLHSEHCRPHAVMRHAGRVEGALRHGAGIIVGSAAVARDLANYADAAKLALPDLVVAPLAGAKLPTSAPAPKSAAPYFLCVGTIESRKNHALLLEVWERLAARGEASPRLVIVGRWGSGSGPVRAALAASRMAGGLIEVIEDCDDARLASLMRGARAMLMPTLAEGFGLPMAEALTLGVPVIASDLPVFREVGQGIPHLIDPRDVEAWTARIAAFDEAAAARQRRIDALRGYCPPVWEEHFERVDAWLATLGGARQDASTPRGPATGRALRLGIEL
ncbi:glycosyl transferase family 1 [Sphingomonas spermidinifaciens]|uniref:Glycosyl transferase family 1 n=1 Tax=Sphingomonas spermidinifaciens TaxID=1141889 RepID=A0A2A4B634_9SPHN|nr:glycosyltransferase family 1 protein [Sphingomonas spermidinifaciens]PCD03405.1 glycosyl transferase family 1 [Sphingomonas spermidinifaciens]